MKNKAFFFTWICLILSACGDGSNPSPNKDQQVQSAKPDNPDNRAPLLSAGQLARPRVANFAPHLRPVDPASKFYIKTKIQKSDQRRVLEITGNEIIIEANHPQGLYELLHKQATYDEIKISAHKLSVNIKVHLPKTKLVLYADELIFGPDGLFDTTPLKREAAAPTKDGLKGDDAQEIEVMVKKFIPASFKSIHFIANGGDGQDAGAALNGRDGRSVVPLGSTTNIVTNCYVNVDPPPGVPGGRVFRTRNSAKNSCPLNLPTDGQDAQSGGLPGAAGDGGIITSNQSLVSQHMLSLEGEIGEPATTGLGGRAGTPNPAFVILLSGHRSSPYHFKKGADAPPPLADLPQLKGERGRFVLINDKTDQKFESDYAAVRLEYAKDLYRSGYPLKAQEIFYEISEKTNKSDHPQALLASMSAHGHLQSLRQELDFYGHTPSYIPTLTLEATGLLFRTEVKRSLEFIALSRFVKKHADDAQKTHLMINEQSRLLFEEIEHKKVIHKNAVKKIPELHDLKNQVISQHDLINQKLKRLESELEDRARRNQSSPLLIKALKTAAALASVMPAGMPAAAQIGMTLNAFTNLRGQDGSFQASALPQVFEAINGPFEWQRSANEWNEFYAPYRLSHLKELSTAERVELLKKLSKQARPLINEMRYQTQRWLAPSVNQEEYQQELAKLKQLSPEFQNLVREIERLVELRSQFETQLSDLMNTVSQTQAIVAQLTEEIGLLNAMDLQNHQKINPELVKLIEARALKAQESLYQYHALMVRAFEYRLLKEYPHQLDLKKIHRYIDELLKDNGELVLDQRYVSLVEGLYKSELSQIVQAIAQELLYAPQELEKTVQFSLSREELRALNQYGEIYLDLEARGVFLEDESQLRLADINVSKVATKSTSVADFLFEHRGEGHLSNGAKDFYFDYQGTNQTKLFRWGSRLNADGELSAYRPTTTQRNLFLAFLEDGLGSNLLQDFELMIRPAALTTMRLRLISEKEIELEDLEVELRYSFR